MTRRDAEPIVIHARVRVDPPEVIHTTVLVRMVDRPPVVVYPNIREVAKATAARKRKGHAFQYSALDDPRMALRLKIRDHIDEATT
jgi:hypothetical protein